MIGTHAFSAGIYSIKHFPLSVLFRKTSPSSKHFIIQSFLEETPISLLLEIAQQICSFSIFSFVTCIYSISFSSVKFKFSSLQTEIYFFLVVIRSNKHPIKNPTRVPQVFIITSSNCANLPINVCKNSIPIENTAPSITPFHQCLWIFLKINTGKNPYGTNRHIFKIVAALNPSSNNLKLI